MTPESSDQTAKLLARASRMRLDAGTVDVLRCFDRAGVRAILLKGAALAAWLYPDGGRTYRDCDLLVAPSDREVAEALLRKLSYTRSFDDAAMPAWWREHAGTWVRDLDGLTIDLHRTLPGVRADPETTWQLLCADTDLVVIGGYRAPALGLPARALHVALHAAQHGVGWPGPLTDLERAVETAQEELWLRAASLAEELDATDAFASGLRLCSGGAQLGDRLGLPAVRSIDAKLRAESPPPLALGFEQLARADGMRQRLEIMARKVVPPPAFVRHWDPRARDSRAMLAWAYARRPAWILRRVPRGLRAWLRARRSVSSGRRGSGG